MSPDAGTEQAAAEDGPAARAAVEAAAEVFSLGDLTGPARVAARGQQGVLWRLETDRGPFAVKELPVPTSEAAVAQDVTLQMAMIRRGVLAPEPLRTAGGKVLAQIGGTLLRVSTWLDLEDPRTDLDPQSVGWLLATLHRDPLPAVPPVDPWYTAPVPLQEWQVVAEALTAASAPFAREFSASIPRFCALQELFRPPRAVQLCHRDLWADNVRLTHDGRLCVIDWDNCGPAEPAQELGVLLAEFCHGNPDRARLLVRAYQRGGGPARVRDRSDFTMVFAQFGHFAITAGRRWLGAADDADRTRAEAWFREGFDQPFDIPQVDELLAAVRVG